MKSWFHEHRSRSSILLFSTVALLITGLLVGAGVVGYKVKTALDREIYGTPRGETPSKTPASLGLPYEDVEFQTGDKKELKGWFIDSDGGQCVILASGKGENKWDMLKYAPFLYEGGYDVLLFDPRSAGESEGDKYAFGYFESRDIIRAVEYLQERQGNYKVAVLGRSAGATAALLAALDEPRINAVIADSPYADLKMASGSYGDYGHDPVFNTIFPIYCWGGEQMLGVDVCQEVNVGNQIEQLDQPVLFIHGLDDTTLVPANSRLLHENTAEPKELWLLEDVEHVRAFEDRPEKYEERVISFLDTHL
ncbi:MAG: alpha/beta hydrolase [Candidatus Bipolaricaulota bacterium]